MASSAYIAFGSNLGDRRSNIERALGSLSAFSEEGMTVSSLWQSKAVDMDDDAGDFLNGVVCIRTCLQPLELLATLQKIEEELGRPEHHPRNRSRTIDLDIICIDDLTLDTPELTIPHPHTRTRRFVLAPLAEIAPALILPGDTKTVKELLHDAPPMEIAPLG